MSKVRNVEIVTGQVANATIGTAVSVSIPMRDAVGYYVTPSFVVVQSKDAAGPNAVFATGAITPATPSTPATVAVTCSEASTPFDLIAFNTDSLI